MFGHVITDTLTDDEDIPTPYVQARVLRRKFGQCFDEVKMTFFKACCTALYTAHLWSNYIKVSLQTLQVAS